MAEVTILIYGDTGDGKTALIGELAEHEIATRGKITRLYSADRGGWLTIQPYVNLGIIEAHAVGDYDPWVWINKCVQGQVPDGKGGWTKPDNSNVGLWAFESITSIADSVMSWMAQASGRGVNIGGQGAFNFKVGEGKDQMTIGTNNQGHYTVAQQRVLEEVWRSQNLAGDFLVWTASARRAADADTNAQILGPQVAGKALTSEVPRWFNYTFRVSAQPQLNAAPKHVLYLEDHVDQQASMAKGLGNARMPLAGTGVKVPFSLEPASIVTALKHLEERQKAAESDIQKRLGDALKRLKR